MTRLGLGEGRPGYPNLPHVQQEITQLLDASRSKQVIWLGRCGRAYKDAITTERGTRDEQMAALLTPVNLPMQGQQAKQKIIDYLATVRDDVALIVVARGGGDEGDLSLFEDAEVLEALRACPAKTLAAVGHANDDLLINRIANWKVNVPKSIHGVLSPHAHGRSTIRQDRRATDQERASRATAQERASRLANQLTDCKEARRIADLEKRKLKKLLAQSEQERRSQTATAAAAEMGHLDQLANAARRRITSSYRYRAALLGVTGTLALVAAHVWAPDSLGLHRAHATYAGAVLLGFVLAVALAPKLLKPHPLFQSSKSQHIAREYANARSVRAYNRVASRPGGKPWWRKRSS